MNPLLDRLQPYPFERLRALLAGVAPPALSAIRLSIGEPQHATPDLVRAALVDHLDGLAVYPTTAGLDAAPRDAGGVVQAALRAAATRCGHRGPAGQRYPRGAVRVCSSGHRPFATRRRSWSARTRSTRSTRAPRCSPAPSRDSSIRRPTTHSTSIWTRSRTMSGAVRS